MYTRIYRKVSIYVHIYLVICICYIYIYIYKHAISSFEFIGALNRRTASIAITV